MMLRTSRVCAVLLVAASVGAGCASGDSASSVDSTPAPQSSATDDTAATTVAPGVATTSPAVETTTPSAPLDTATARAVVDALLAGDDELNTCPLGDMEALSRAAAVDFVPGQPEVSASAERRRVRCIVRSQGEVFEAASWEVVTDPAIVADYLESGTFLATLEPIEVLGGTLQTKCPKEQTVGDVPEHCESHWFSGDGLLVVSFSSSGPAESPEAAQQAAMATVPMVIASLDAIDLGSIATSPPIAAGPSMTIEINGAETVDWDPLGDGIGRTAISVALEVTNSSTEEMSGFPRLGLACAGDTTRGIPDSYGELDLFSVPTVDLLDVAPGETVRFFTMPISYPNDMEGCPDGSPRLLVLGLDLLLEYVDNPTANLPLVGQTTTDSSFAILGPVYDIEGL